MVSQVKGKKYNNKESQQKHEISFLDYHDTIQARSNSDFDVKYATM
jgi:hypothetical protein